MARDAPPFRPPLRPALALADSTGSGSSPVARRTTSKAVWFMSFFGIRVGYHARARTPSCVTGASVKLHHYPEDM